MSFYALLRILVLLPVLGWGAGAAVPVDPRVSDLIEIHCEAIGGRARIAALATLRASGHVVAGGTRLGFRLSAARPNLVRLETGAAERIRVQGFDGKGRAWEKDLDYAGRPVREMPAAAARIFVADAEFDDPLIGGPDRGYAFDFAGEAARGEGKVVRLQVSRSVGESFTLLIDMKTFLIISRHEERLSAGGRRVPVVTDWSDFRPVAGVLLAHRIVVTMDGRTVQETQITEIEANPVLAPETFGPPQPVAMPPAGS